MSIQDMIILASDTSSLRSLSLTGAYKRAYLASCPWHSAQIPLRGTSDTLGTLGETVALNIRPEYI